MCINLQQTLDHKTFDFSPYHDVNSLLCIKWVLDEVELSKLKMTLTKERCEFAAKLFALNHLNLLFNNLNLCKNLDEYQKGLLTENKL